MLLHCRHPGGVPAFRPPQILGYSRAVGLASKATRRHSERSLPVLLFIRRVCCDGCRQTQPKNLSSIERAAKIYVQERSLARVAPLGMMILIGSSILAGLLGRGCAEQVANVPEIRAALGFFLDGFQADVKTF